MENNDGLINNSQSKLLIRTERLLESNHNLEKILDHLLEQVSVQTEAKQLIIPQMKVFACNNAFSTSSRHAYKSIYFPSYLAFFPLFPHSSFKSLGHFLLLQRETTARLGSDRLLESRVERERELSKGKEKTNEQLSDWFD